MVALFVKIGSNLPQSYLYFVNCLNAYLRFFIKKKILYTAQSHISEMGDYIHFINIAHMYEHRTHRYIVPPSGQGSLECQRA